MRDLIYTYHAAQDVGRRENQEDAWGISAGDDPNGRGQIFVVCDGMGGMEMGERFSSLGVVHVVEGYGKLPPDMPLREKLIACWADANSEAVKLVREEEIRGGSTMVAVAVRGRECCFISVGDSRILLHRGGESILLTRQHTLGEILDLRAALGIILKEDAKNSFKRDALTNSLGMVDKAPDVCSYPFELLPGDRIVLMSDGVFNTLSDDEIDAFLREETDDDGPDIAQRMIHAVKAKGAERQDNCTVIVLDVIN